MELDLVMVLNKQGQNFDEVRKRAKAVIRNNLPDIKLLKAGKTSQPLKGQKGNIVFEMDFVPTYWLDSPRQVHKVKNRYAYQGITTRWSVEYVKQCKADLPHYVNCVWLLKDWKKKNGIPSKSFVLELVVASALAFRGKKKKLKLHEAVGLCFRELMSMTDGTPVQPYKWKHCEEEDFERFEDFEVVIIDPANPLENLGEVFEPEDLKLIKSQSSKAISWLRSNDYDKVFKPEKKYPS